MFSAEHGQTVSLCYTETKGAVYFHLSLSLSFSPDLLAMLLHCSS